LRDAAGCVGHGSAVRGDNHMSNEPSLDRKKILIVEDEMITLTLTRKILVEAGYEVVATQDGGSAVSLAMAEHPNLILLDLGLPATDPFSGTHFDGFIIIDWMHRMMKELSIPIIVVTSQVDPEVRAKVLDAGAVAFFTKPADSKKLLTAIQIALDSN
jgi:CheY-like chemotaxis protein